MQTNRIGQLSVPTNTVLHGDCISLMRSLPVNSIDFILTDPPLLGQLSGPGRPLHPERQQRRLARTGICRGLSRSQAGPVQAVGGFASIPTRTTSLTSIRCPDIGVNGDMWSGAGAIPPSRAAADADRSRP